MSFYQCSVSTSQETMDKCIVILCVVFGVAIASPMLNSATPKANSFWSGTAMDNVVKQLHTECSDHNDAVSCMKYKVLHFIDQVFSKDSVQVTENVTVVKNSKVTEAETGRGENSDFLEHVENYIQAHDVVAKLPEGTILTLSPRNLDHDELSLNVKFASPAEREGKAVGEARKSKLKKVIIPILVFVLLKAMTLIPLAIGVLGLKAWNALQLSFFSFVISVALAIFQLCKKIAADASSAQVAAHGPWDNYQAAHYAARTFPQEFIPPQEDVQELVYNAYAGRE